ncbi:Bardet-Biedl syndrome 4 protein [Cichlidogyrus casuarinus]|uniref:Bardet-Biedl syndrome 4 protein n=1 Tax=Cichlidogyrus casuarinus TaxID=1844966 RepID=A0ABD2QKX2_9PLAT
MDILHPDSFNWLVHYSYVNKLGTAFRKSKQLSQLYGISECASYYSGLFSLQNNDPKSAFDSFNTALLFKPSCKLYKKLLNTCIFFAGDFKTAIRTLESLIEESPNEWAYYHQAASCHFFLKNYDLAIANALKAFEHSNDERIHQLLALLLQTISNHEDCIGYLKKGINYHQYNQKMLFMLAKSLMQTNQTDLCLEYLSKLLKLNPNHSHGLVMMNSILLDRGQADEAMKNFSRLASIDFHSEVLWNNLAFLFFSKNRFMATLTSLKVTFNLNSHSILKINHCFCLIKMGLYASALLLLEPIVLRGVWNGAHGTLESYDFLQFLHAFLLSKVGQDSSYILDAILAKADLDPCVLYNIALLKESENLMDKFENLVKLKEFFVPKRLALLYENVDLNTT